MFQSLSRPLVIDGTPFVHEVDGALVCLGLAFHVASVRVKLSHWLPVASREVRPSLRTQPSVSCHGDRRELPQKSECRQPSHDDARDLRLDRRDPRAIGTMALIAPASSPRARISVGGAAAGGCPGRLKAAESPADAGDSALPAEGGRFELPVRQ